MGWGGGKEIIVFAGVRYGELINSKLTWKKVPSQIVCKELIKNRDFQKLIKHELHMAFFLNCYLYKILLFNDKHVVQIFCSLMIAPS